MMIWLPVTEATLPASSATMTARESRATRSSRPGGHQRRFGDQQRHRLALHVGPHQRAVRVVVLQERNQARRHRHELLGRDVHVIHPRRLDVNEVALAPADDPVGSELALVVNRRVGLGDDECFLAVGREVIQIAR